jgi:hypothetical protein
MASATAKGQIKIVAERGTKQVTLWSGRSDGTVSAGGSPDGVLANKTAEKQLFVPRHPARLRGGDIIRIMFKLDAADGMDASDATFIVPISEDGAMKELSTADFSFTSDKPAGTLAEWMELGTGYTIPVSISEAYFGHGRLVIAPETDD